MMGEAHSRWKSHILDVVVTYILHGRERHHLGRRGIQTLDERGTLEI